LAKFWFGLVWLGFALGLVGFGFGLASGLVWAGSAQPGRFKASRLQGFKPLRFPGFQGFEPSRLPGFKASRFQGFKASMLQGIKAARLQASKFCLGLWFELALDLVWLGLGLGCTNDVQMAPKWSPNGPQMAPKWRPNGPTERPKSCHHRTSKETQTNGSTMTIYIVIHDQNNDEVTIV